MVTMNTNECSILLQNYHRSSNHFYIRMLTHLNHKSITNVTDDWFNDTKSTFLTSYIDVPL